MQDHLLKVVIDSKIVERTQDSLSKLRANATRQWRRLETTLRELTANPTTAVNGEGARLTESLSSGLAWTKAHLSRTQDALVSLGGNVVGKGQNLGKVLRKLHADSFDVVSDRAAKFRVRLRSQSEVVKAQLLRAQGAFIKLRRRADKSRKLRTRKNDLRRLIASSPDAVVVTSSDRRFVEANAKGLGLFGISETNMTMFTLDVFLSGGQIPRFAENGTSFINRKETHGQCEIRRLDGSLRVAEYAFVANYVPFLHVFRFQNDRKWTHGKRLAA